MITINWFPINVHPIDYHTLDHCYWPSPPLTSNPDHYHTGYHTVHQVFRCSRAVHTRWQTSSGREGSFHFEKCWNYQGFTLSLSLFLTTSLSLLFYPYISMWISPLIFPLLINKFPMFLYLYYLYLNWSYTCKLYIVYVHCTLSMYIVHVHYPCTLSM